MFKRTSSAPPTNALPSSLSRSCRALLEFAVKVSCRHLRARCKTFESYTQRYKRLSGRKQIQSQLMQQPLCTPFESSGRAAEATNAMRMRIAAPMVRQGPAISQIARLIVRPCPTAVEAVQVSVVGLGGSNPQSEGTPRSHWQGPLEQWKAPVLNLCCCAGVVVPCEYGEPKPPTSHMITSSHCCCYNGIIL